MEGEIHEGQPPVHYVPLEIDVIRKLLKEYDSVSDEI
jgi:hypothetical protein